MTTQTSLHSSPVTIYIQEGIQAMKAGDIQGSSKLLKQAVKLDPHNQDAWLWLSGTLSNPEEQRYCLEQVLRMNPDHKVAQHGLASLKQQQLKAQQQSSPEPQLIAQPVVQPKPAQQLQPSTQPPEPCPAPKQHSWIPVSSSAPTSLVTVSRHVPLEEQASTTQLLNHDQNVHFSSAGIATQMLPQNQADQQTKSQLKAQPDPAPIGPKPAPLDPVTQDIIAALGKSSTAEEVARMLCMKHGYDWHTAQEKVQQVQSHYARKIARHQSPYMFALSIVSLIGGLGILIYFVFLSQAAMVDPEHHIGLIARLIRRLPQVVTGLGLTVGGGVGVVQTIASLWANEGDAA